jgi:hypothetical protein
VPALGFATLTGRHKPAAPQVAKSHGAVEVRTSSGTSVDTVHETRQLVFARHIAERGAAEHGIADHLFGGEAGVESSEIGVWASNTASRSAAASASSAVAKFPFCTCARIESA